MASVSYAVLIVDRNEEVFTALDTVSHKRFTLHRVAGAQEALEWMRTATAHVVLVDHLLPEMSGIEFCSTLRQEHPEMLRILMVEAEGTEPAVDAVGLGHLFRYVVKPCDPVELENILFEACLFADPTEREATASASGGGEEETYRARSVEPVPLPDFSLFREIFSAAVERDAHEIHLEPHREGMRLRYRIGTRLYEARTIDPAQGTPLAFRIKSLAGLQHQEGKFAYQTFSLALDNGVRKIELTVIPSIWGDSLLIKLHPKRLEPIALGQLGFTQAEEETLQRILEHRSGLAVVTGPARSGKTSTLYALLNDFDLSRYKAVTIGHHVPYELSLGTQLDLSKLKIEIAEALGFILPQSPDLLLIESIHGKEILRRIFPFALGGRFVLAGLPFAGAFTALDYLREMSTSATMLSDTLKLIVAQRLVRRLCPACKEPVPFPPVLANRLRLSERALPQQIFEPRGCSECEGGYRGLILLSEIVEISENIRSMLTMNRPTQDIQMYLRGHGFRGIPEIATEFFMAGETGLEDLYFFI
ncbi:MAG: response regulator [Deltaproteobacteria bacterium]|nr:MAG: response regulator [Deltaproteobacteria bacterium]